LDQPLPAWLDWATRAVICLAAGLLLTGMPLAMAGAYRPGAGIPLALLAAAGLLWLARPAPERRATAGRRVVLPALGAVALAIASAVVNAHFSAQHVLADRDPGIYLWFGRWISHHGSLFLDNPRQFFPSVKHGVLAQCPVTCRGAPGDRLYVQFLHGLPVTLGAAGWLGGAGAITKANAVLGGFSLLAFYALGTRMMRPLFALLATAALAVSFPQVYFARDTYSEILAQLLLLGGLWLLWEARSLRSARVAAVAGLALGLTCTVRIDSFLYAIPLIAYAFGELAFGDRALRRPMLALMGAGAVGGALGVLDLHLFSRGYLHLQHTEVRPLELAIVATAIAGAALWALRSSLGPLRSALYALRSAAAVVIPAAILIAGVLAWLVRPHVQHLTAGFDHELPHLQRVNGLAVEPHRTYGEDGLRWIGWYLGPVGVAAGIAGLALAVREIVLGRRPLLVPLVGVVGVAGVLYVADPHIFPDQIWAMRRYVPAVIPGLVLLGVWAAQGLPWRPAALALAVAVAVIPAVHLAPVAGVHEQASGLAAIGRVCDSLPPHAAVWTIPGPVETRLIQPVHAFCGVPVGQSPPHARGDVMVQAKRTAAAHGRTLVLISTRPGPLQRAVAGDPPRPVTTYRFERLEQTLTRRPVHRRPQSVGFYVAAP
jgi:hypothetical protein